ncbi:hypothetical protein [Lysobacter olei]
MAQRWQEATPARYPVPKAVQFVSPEEFLTLALQSHLAAVRDTIPPCGEPWRHPECETAWAGPEDFFEMLLHHLGERLRLRALVRGDLVEEPWDTADADDLVAAGHGDAVPAPDAPEGPQQSANPDGDRSPAALPGHPLFACPPGQGLPRPAEGLNVNGAAAPEVHHAV